MSINVSEVIWTIVCFFALLFVLKKFLFDPLIRFMEQRQAAIDQGLERGRDAQRKKDENDAALREKWKERSVEVKQLLAEGKTADDRERAWVLESTQKETNKALQEANQRIEQERRAGVRRCPGAAAAAGFYPGAAAFERRHRRRGAVMRRCI